MGQPQEKSLAALSQAPFPACLLQFVKNNLSPIWEPFKVSLNSLCSCEEKRRLRVSASGGGGQLAKALLDLMGVLATV